LSSAVRQVTAFGVASRLCDALMSRGGSNTLAIYYHVDSRSIEAVSAVCKLASSRACVRRSRATTTPQRSDRRSCSESRSFISLERSSNSVRNNCSSRRKQDTASNQEVESGASEQLALRTTLAPPGHTERQQLQQKTMVPLEVAGQHGAHAVRLNSRSAHTLRSNPSPRAASSSTTASITSRARFQLKLTQKQRLTLDRTRRTSSRVTATTSTTAAHARDRTPTRETAAPASNYKALTARHSECPKT
jgi:hypothetical protein